MAKPEARIKIRADDTAAVSTFRRVTNTLLSLKTLILGGLGFFSLNKLMEITVGVAASADRAFIRLATSMKAAGRFTREAAESFKGLAVTLERETGFIEEDILQALAVLQTFGRMTRDDMEKTIVAALNMATIMGEPVTQAAIRLGKAYAGNITGLRMVGVSIDKATVKAKGWQGVLDQLAIEQGGQAQARMAGFAGLLNRVGVAFGEAGKAAGKFVSESKTATEVVEIFVNALIIVAKWLDKKRAAEEDDIETIREFTKLTKEQAAAIVDLGKKSIIFQFVKDLEQAKREISGITKHIELVQAQSVFATGDIFNQIVPGLEKLLRAAIQRATIAQQKLNDVLSSKEVVDAINKNVDANKDQAKTAKDAADIELDSLNKIHNEVWKNLQARAIIAKIQTEREKELNDRRKALAEENEQTQIDSLNAIWNKWQQIAELMSISSEERTRKEKEFAAIQVEAIEEIGLAEEKALQERASKRAEFLQKQIAILKRLQEQEKKRADEAIKQELEQTETIFDRATADEAENRLLEEGNKLKKQSAELRKFEGEELEKLLTKAERLEGFLPSLSAAGREQIKADLKLIREEISLIVSGKDLTAMKIELDQANLDAQGDNAGDTLVNRIKNKLKDANFEINVKVNLEQGGRTIKNELENELNKITVKPRLDSNWVSGQGG